MDFFFLKRILFCNDLTSYRFVNVSQISFVDYNSEMLDSILSTTAKCKLEMTFVSICSHFLFAIFFYLSPIASKQFSFLKMTHFHFPQPKIAPIEFFYFKFHYRLFHFYNE